MAEMAQHRPLERVVAPEKSRLSRALQYRQGTHSQSLWALEEPRVLVESIPLCVICVPTSQSLPIVDLPALRVWAPRAVLVAPALDRATLPTTVALDQLRVVQVAVLDPQPMAGLLRAVRVVQPQRVSQSLSAQPHIW